MKKNIVDMGSYYTNLTQKNLVRTICRAYSESNGEDLIIYAYVGEGGIVSDTYYMPEKEFISKYVL